jgi:arylsulfatase A-like enzyme
MMWPARVPAGRTVSDFVNFADIAPTILDAAGLPVPPDMSGRSALNVLLSKSAGRVDPSRDFTVAGLEWHGDLPPCGQAARMIRDERFQYIVNYSDGPRFPLTDGKQQPDAAYEQNAATLDVAPLLSAHRDHPAVKRLVSLIQAPRLREELYDCAADPAQLKNLADAPEFADVKQKLRARLEACQRQTKDPRITGEMAIFEETLKFVRQRKSAGYSDTKTPAKSAKPKRKARQ